MCTAFNAIAKMVRVVASISCCCPAFTPRLPLCLPQAVSSLPPSGWGNPLRTHWTAVDCSKGQGAFECSQRGGWTCRVVEWKSGGGQTSGPWRPGPSKTASMRSPPLRNTACLSGHEGLRATHRTGLALVLLVHPRRPFGAEERNLHIASGRDSIVHGAEGDHEAGVLQEARVLGRAVRDTAVREGVEAWAAMRGRRRRARGGGGAAVGQCLCGRLVLHNQERAHSPALHQ